MPIRKIVKGGVAKKVSAVTEMLEHSTKTCDKRRVGRGVGI